MQEEEEAEPLIPDQISSITVNVPEVKTEAGPAPPAGQPTKHARLAGEAARGQRRLPMVEVMRADIVPQVGGATGHPEGRGAEETRAQGACDPPVGGATGEGAGPKSEKPGRRCAGLAFY